MSAVTQVCWHCGEPAGGGALWRGDRAFCCVGCEAAAQWISQAGLGDYYRLREVPATRVTGAADSGCWDSPAWQSRHVQTDGEWLHLTLPLDGMRCAACAWLVEHALAREPGVASVSANVVQARIALRWNPRIATLSHLVACLSQLGFRARRPGPATAPGGTRRQAMKRLVVGGLGAMQAMMFSEALYFGAGSGMPEPTRDLFRWIGLAISVPVVAYAGAPILRGGWNQCLARRPGMDLLVSLSVLLALVGSAVETWRGGPVVYFDAAVMFVFLLGAARFVEDGVRRRAGSAARALADAEPGIAHRIDGGIESDVALDDLHAGDRLRVRPGEALPGDGTLATAAELDESLLTGEARPVSRAIGESVLGGSVCLGAPLEFVLQAAGDASVLGQLRRVVEAGSLRPSPAAAQADRVARVFASVLLPAALAVALVWSQLDASRVLPVLLAVMAVACPCALALAVPTALAAAQSRLARRGVLVMRDEALMALARIDTLLIDKTGTLTLGRFSVESLQVGAGIGADRALAIAAALERDVAHPIAAAFRRHDRGLAASAVRVHVGAGVEGHVDGASWRLGAPAFALGTGDRGGDSEDDVLLVRGGAIAARFRLRDALRPESPAALEALRARGVACGLVSGDAPDRVAEVAEVLRISDARARLSPTDKHDLLRAAQRQGRVVGVLGDGSNDAEALSGADVALAMGEGAALAHAAAGIVLVGGDLRRLAWALDVARATRRITRQNFAWAIAYNALGLPLAAAGLVSPWFAALGMSLSSLLVTLNAARLARDAGAPPRSDAVAHNAAATPRLADSPA